MCCLCNTVGECTDSGCCVEEEEDACFQRTGKAFKMCRPRTALCADGDWDCPTLSLPPLPPLVPLPVAPPPEPMPPAPPPCAGNYQRCWSGEIGSASNCCVPSSASSFGCYRKRERLFAMCRPMAEDGACIDDGDVNGTWTCPGWDAQPPSMPSPPLLPSPPELPPPPPPAPPPSPPCTNIYKNCHFAFKRHNN